MYVLRKWCHFYLFTSKNPTFALITCFSRKKIWSVFKKIIILSVYKNFTLIQIGSDAISRNPTFRLISPKHDRLTAIDCSLHRSAAMVDYLWPASHLTRQKHATSICQQIRNHIYRGLFKFQFKFEIAHKFKLAEPLIHPWYNNMIINIILGPIKYHY